LSSHVAFVLFLVLKNPEQIDSIHDPKKNQLVHVETVRAELTGKHNHNFL
jgi:hypothetical protein